MANINDRVNVGVGVVVLRQFYDGWRVLLGKRINHKHGRGEYSLPGGKPDPGESPRDAGIRELFEETAMQPKEANALRLWTYDRWEEWDVHAVCVYFDVVTTDEPVNTEPEKCAGWYWHRVDRLPDPMMNGARRAIAEALACRL